MAEYVEIPLAGFAGGLNTELDATALEINELSEALNVRIGNKGEVERRTGYVRFDNSMVKPAIHLHRWVSKDGVDNMIVIDTVGDLWVRYEANPQSFTKKATVGTSSVDDPAKYPVSFAAGEDNLYISTLRRTALMRWNGTVLEDVTAVYTPPADPAGGDLPTYVKPPVGRHMTYRHGRLMIGHTTATKSRVWFSDYLQPERFQTEAWVDLDPEDGSTITGMVNYGDELVIFKDNSMWELTGRDPTVYSLRTIDQLRGTVSPGSICQVRGLLVWFDRDTGVWAYNGSQSELISEKINTYLLDGIEYSEAHRATAYFGDDRLYLSVPWVGPDAPPGADPDTRADPDSGGPDVGAPPQRWRTFVMNAQNQAWSEYDSGFTVGHFHDQDRFQGYDGLTGLYIADPSRDDIEGLGDYVSRMRTPWMFPVSGGAKGRMRRLELVVDAVPSSLSSFQIDLYRELDGRDPHVTRMFHTDPLPFDTRAVAQRAMHQVTLDGWGMRWHSMQLAVTMSHIPSRLNRMTMFVTGGLDQRGERRA